MLRFGKIKVAKENVVQKIWDFDVDNIIIQN